MGDWSLAIDFGTCFTCAAIRVGEQVEVLETDSGRYTPSLVYRDESGELLTGRRAASQAETFPARVARVPKRELVNRSPVLLGGAVVDAEDLAAAVLSTMAGEALRRSGGVPPQEVVLTHPAAWTSDDIAALGEAAKRAHLPSARFVPEPVAAAAFYTQREDIPAGAHVAVYDLGGGTFDVAVLRRTTTGFDVIAQGGNDRIGGEDFDEALHELVAGHATTLDPAAWQDFTQATGLRATRDRALLRRDITEAKELLSDTTIRQVIVGDLTVSVTRTEFEAAIMEDLRATITTFQDVVTRAGFTLNDLTAVYLTGGSSRIPLVSDLLSHHLGRTPDLAADPKAVVALGALSWAVRPSLPEPMHLTAYATLTCFAGPVGRVAFSPDGTILATPDVNNLVRLWDVSHGAEPRLSCAFIADHNGGTFDLEFAPAGTIIATTGGDSNVYLYEVGNPEQILQLAELADALDEFTNHTDLVEDVAFSSDGTRMATASRDKTVLLWDITAIHSPRRLATFIQENDEVNGVAFSPDGRILATAGKDGTATLWRISDGGFEGGLYALTYKGPVLSVAFSPVGTILSVGGADPEARVQLWDVSSTNPRPLAILGHPAWVRGVAFSPDGTRFATACDDGIVRLWDVGSLDRPSAILEGHTDWVRGVTFSPDGTTLATSAKDGTVRLWAVGDC
ncbi:Hsp70 family protein [Microbispora hainanensis]|uniref:Hsp70 family protein n=1 Tax=Microbispora hainanensis TaxID=568844 RepID=A0ABZ1SIU6_9ACTN|nr:Hsp70 family protein [Microbispora hainanensis]